MLRGLYVRSAISVEVVLGEVSGEVGVERVPFRVQCRQVAGLPGLAGLRVVDVSRQLAGNGRIADFRGVCSVVGVTQIAVDTRQNRFTCIEAVSRESPLLQFASFPSYVIDLTFTVIQNLPDGLIVRRPSDRRPSVFRFSPSQRTHLVLPSCRSTKQAYNSTKISFLQ